MGRVVLGIILMSGILLLGCQDVVLTRQTPTPEPEYALSSSYEELRRDVDRLASLPTITPQPTPTLLPTVTPNPTVHWSDSNEGKCLLAMIDAGCSGGGLRHLVGRLNGDGV